MTLPPSTERNAWQQAVIRELGVAHDFGSGQRVYVNAFDRNVVNVLDTTNLLNTPLEFTEGPSQSRPIQREFYDITLLAGVRVSL